MAEPTSNKERQDAINSAFLYPSMEAVMEVEESPDLDVLFGRPADTAPLPDSEGSPLVLTDATTTSDIYPSEGGGDPTSSKHTEKLLDTKQKKLSMELPQEDIDLQRAIALSSLDVENIPETPKKKKDDDWEDPPSTPDHDEEVGSFQQSGTGEDQAEEGPSEKFSEGGGSGSGDGDSSEQVLVQARIVEETELVIAEPLTLPLGGDNAEAESSKAKNEPTQVQSRGWIFVSVLLVVLAAIILAVVLTRPSNEEGNDHQGAGATSSVPNAGATGESETSTAVIINNNTGAGLSDKVNPAMAFLPDYTRESIALDGLGRSGQTPAWEWLQNHREFGTMPTWRKLQLMGLATLYYATKGDSWDVPPLAPTWMNDTLHECDWQGRFIEEKAGAKLYWALVDINCTSNGAYLNLTLQGTGLRGTLPPEVSLLTALTTLDLSANFITGSIPTEIGSMTSLEGLILANNVLEGPLPQELFHLTDLTVLRLGGETRIKFPPADNLQLGINSFTETISTEIAALTALTHLGLQGNELSGTIPLELSSITTLRVLEIGENLFSGTLLSEFAKLTQLERLIAGKNRWRGTVPTELGILTKLAYLELNLTQLSGPIPSEIGLLTSLTSLGFHGNRLSAALPSEMNALSNLTFFNFSANDLTGTLPDLSGLTRLEALQGRENRFSGMIPDLSSMKDLRVLWLYDNAFTGPLPSGLSMLTSLEDVRLHTNPLTGPLYPTFTPLLKLTDVFVQNTSLTGTVPSSVCESLVLKEFWIDCDEVSCSCSQCRCMHEQ